MKKEIKDKILAQINKITKSERIIFVTSFIWMISCFFNWFITEKNIYLSYNAFNWIWAVLWYFFFLCLLSIFLIIILKINKSEVKLFIEKHNWIYLFLTWEALFISICAFLIYTSYWISISNSEIWFWLHIAIISQIIWLLTSHFYFLKKNKKNRKTKTFEMPITKYK